MTHPLLFPRRYVHVHDIVVDPAFQRTGVARQLLDKAKEWAAVQGANQIQLNVLEFNKRAIAVYEKYGFITTSRRMRLDL